MTDKISFDLVSPERLLLSEDAEMVTIPGAEGEMGVMAGHMALISTLKPRRDRRQDRARQARPLLRQRRLRGSDRDQADRAAEEAIPLEHLDEAALKQRIIDAQEDIATAKSDTEMQRATEALDQYRTPAGGGIAPIPRSGSAGRSRRGPSPTP